MGCKLTKYIYSFTVLTVRYFFFMPLYIAYFAGKYLTFYFMAIVDSLISCCFSFVCSCTPEMFTWLIDYLVYNNDNCHFSQMFLNVRIYFKYCCTIGLKKKQQQAALGYCDCIIFWFFQWNQSTNQSIDCLRK